jgi:hypothetical protein
MKCMRGLIFTISAGMLLALSAGTFASAGDENEQTIRSIRSQYTAINRAARRYTTVKRDLPGYSAEGGALTGYYSGSVLRKIEATFYGETGRTTEEFYFSPGHLIFVVRTASFYDKPLSGHVIRREQTRFYFDQGKLIRWLDASQSPVATEGAAARDQENDLLQSARTFISRLRSPANTTGE